MDDGGDGAQEGMEAPEGDPAVGQPVHAHPPVAGLLRGDGADRRPVFGGEGGLPARRHPPGPAPGGRGGPGGGGGGGGGGRAPGGVGTPGGGPRVGGSPSPLPRQ